MTAWRYDGQSCVEEAYLDGSHKDSIRHVSGPRGVELTSTKNWNDSSYQDAFAAYDAHGNRIASIKRNGSRTHDLADVRGYDAWGKAVSGATTGRPYARYCASVGHRADDESGLVYMRARYYDPQAGRFINQDPSMQASNCFSYCGGDPVNRLDQTGRDHFDGRLIYAFGAGVAYTIGTLLIGFSAALLYSSSNPQNIAEACTAAIWGMTVLGFGLTLANGGVDFALGNIAVQSILGAALRMAKAINLELMATEAAIGQKTQAAEAVACCFAYNLYVASYLIASENETDFFNND